MCNIAIVDKKLTADEKQGLSESQCTSIEELHKIRKVIMTRPHFYFSTVEEAAEVLHGISFVLQWLWGFPLDKEYHTEVYEFEDRHKGGWE